MRMRTIEIAVGAFMLAGILALVFLAFRVSGFAFNQQGKTYHVTARFKDIGGLTLRAKVSMSGVTIGRVTGMRVDTTAGQAIVDMALDYDAGHVSSDAGAKIVTEGLLGGKFISIVPGAEDTYLKEGSVIQDTQGALILEDLIGQFLKSMGK